MLRCRTQRKRPEPCPRAISHFFDRAEAPFAGAKPEACGALPTPSVQDHGQRRLPAALREVLAAAHDERTSMKLACLRFFARPGNIPFVDFPSVAPISRLSYGTRYERCQCGDHHWCHLCRLYQVGAGFAGSLNLHWMACPPRTVKAR